MLAVNIADRELTWGAFLRPLPHYGQTAPAGFLAIERAIADLLGASEYALRLWPLLAGILSLFLLHWIAARVLNRSGSLVALGLFCLAGPLIRYSAEVKQYSSDVLFALLIAALGMWVVAGTFRIGKAVCFAAAGAIALWLSHPAMFVVAGVGIGLLISFARRRHGHEMALLLLPGGVCSVSLFLCYQFSIRHLAAVGDLRDYWKSGFLPWSGQAPEWLVDHFFGVFSDPFGAALPGVAALAFLLGLWWMSREQRDASAVLLTPALVTLLGAALHKYPFSGRLILFLVPTLVVVVAAGIGFLFSRGAEWKGLATLVTVLLFLHPVVRGTVNFLAPTATEDVRPLLQYVDRQRRSGDLVYVQYGAAPIAQYYAPRLGWPVGSYVVGEGWRGNLDGYAADWHRVASGRRVWLVTTQARSWRAIPEDEIYLEVLEKHGHVTDKRQVSGASVWLWESDAEARSGVHATPGRW